MNINNENEHARALIFKKRKTIIHISKLDGIFHNGIILEVGSNFIILKDKVSGKEPIIFFSELKKPLESFTEDQR